MPEGSKTAMNKRIVQWSFGAATAVALAASAAAQTGSNRPWLDRSLGADQRAELAVAQMTRDEKLQLVFGYFATDADYKNN
jgi:beta-glucosidase